MMRWIQKIELNLTSQPSAVEMDIIDVQQVAWNLIRNAIKAMRDNGVLRHCPAKPRGSKFYFAVPAIIVRDH